MIDKNNAVFLLGGHDLEMVTIRDILIQNGFELGKNLFDKELSWGAKLSDYDDVIEANKDKKIYAIELTEDRVLPLNYLRIDHHNDYIDREACLLQVLKLLDIEPSDNQKIIAENDVRYIPGMQCLGVNEETIKEIREKDRKAQGISSKDEQAGKNDVKRKDVKKHIEIICATTPFFTAITDSLYFDVPADKRESKTIIYNDSKIVFYGFLLTDMQKLFKEENIKEDQYYFGGGYNGFIGIKDEAISKSEIINLKDKCVEKNSDASNDIYSYHTFMLPFRFDKIIEPFSNTYDYYQKKDISERISIVDKMMEKLLSDKWEHKPFTMESNSDYNEYAYFYSFIRETLYNKENFSENKTSYFFEKAYKGGKYELKIKNQTYKLELEGLSLRIFETGIAIFSIEVSNRKLSQSKIDDILKINEYGRRIYAPFLGRWEEEANWTQSPKNSQLAESVKVILPDAPVCDDDFSKEYKKIPDDIQISSYILKLLGEETFTTDKKKVGQYFIQPIIDDRMFVLSWYGNDAYSESLRNDKYIDNSKWYEYVFVDGDGSTVHNKKMQHQLIEESTYDRWMNYEDGLTLFGLSRYSFVCLSNGSGFSQNVLPLPHMKTMYFQMFTLLLAIRASTLRFSEEVTALSNIKDETDSDFSKKVSSLYKYYIKFVNKIYFREITAQEQGIELYDKASDLMRIERDVKDLDAEIAELHTYVSMKTEEKQVQHAEAREARLENISKLGAVFLPPSLIAGIFGMNVFDFNQSGPSILLVLFFMVLSSLLGYFLISSSEKNDKKKTDVKALDKECIGLIGLVFISIILLYFSYASPNNAQDVNIKNPDTIMQKVVNYLNKSQNKKGEKNENNQTK